MIVNSVNPVKLNGILRRSYAEVVKNKNTDLTPRGRWPHIIYSECLDLLNNSFGYLTERQFIRSSIGAGEGLQVSM